MLRQLLVLVIASQLALGTSVFAADEDRLSYPELEVAPRATERVQIEAKKEIRGRWLVHLPIQASSLLTIFAASSASEKDGLTANEKSRFDERVQNASYIGYGWFLTTLVMAASYKPYTSGFKELKQLPVKDKRDELTRERLAEEVLYRPATVAKAMTWLSVVTQIGANALLMTDADEDSIAIASIALVGSFAPLVFGHPWVDNAENHKLYKKKIYGPIAGPVLLPKDENKYALGYGFQWSF